MVLPFTLERTEGLCMPCFKRPKQEALGKQHAQDLHDDDLIEAGRQRYERMIGHQNKEEALEYFKSIYSSLLPFLSDNGLLVKALDSRDIQDWYQFEMRYSMLTERGKTLFDQCYMKWLEGHDRGTKPEYLGLWKKHLKNL